MARDINGHPVEVRGLRRFRRDRGAPELDPHDETLTVLAGSTDPAVSSASVLAQAGDRVAAGEVEVVLRHLLVIPPDAVDEVVATAAQDHYVRVDHSRLDEPGPEPGPARTDTDAGLEGFDPEVVADAPNATEGRVTLLLARTQLIDAMHCSQERSRVAGLAARHNGDVVGWQILGRV